MHVRRSDKFATACETSQFSRAECARMEAITRPAALGRALALWYPNGTRIYVSSTEPPAFFSSLRSEYALYLPEDFATELSSVTNNYALYAVETLVLFCAASVVQASPPPRSPLATRAPRLKLASSRAALPRAQTFGYASSWFADACFPAASLRQHAGSPRRQHAAAQPLGRGTALAGGSTYGPTDGGALGSSGGRAAAGLSRRGLQGTRRSRRAGHSSALDIECVGADSIRVNGVHYGAACAVNPPCGTMSFIPPEGAQPRGCGKLLRLPSREAADCGG